ncbi:unnamed protein product [Clonostachys byssicola]|uniref:superoxide dismutase n=1 Tax=Clonostachys byssicola TaxID=160290 RepID=A0A9N9XUZ4_9HYPO|nr:unnamed protein product [Clonostachys byssicola]
MHGKTALMMLSAAAMVSAREAPVTNNNPVGDVYQAVLPGTSFFPGGPKIQGSITAQAGDNGRGVKFNVHFEGIPAAGGPFTYHLHLKPVPEGGNCTATSSHLDPYEAGAVVTCDASKPATCEVGDLAGKHGKIESAGTYDKTYQDDYASTTKSDAAFFGDKSFVLHYGGNNTRITCANFVKKSSGGNSTTTTPGQPTGTGSPVIPSSSAPAATTSSPPINAAGRLSSWSASAVLAVAGGAAIYFGL